MKKKELMFFVIILVVVISVIFFKKDNEVTQNYLFITKNEGGGYKSPYIMMDDQLKEINNNIINSITNDNQCISLTEIIQFPTKYANKDGIINGGDLRLFENGKMVAELNEIYYAYRIVSFVNEKQFISKSCNITFSSAPNESTDTLYFEGYLDQQLATDLGIIDYINKNNQYYIEVDCFVPKNKNGKYYEYEPVTLTIGLKGISNNKNSAEMVECGAIYLDYEDMKKLLEKYAIEEIHQNVWLLETNSDGLIKKIKKMDSEISVYKDIW